jgi:hypothetical protein
MGRPDAMKIASSGPRYQRGKSRCNAQRHAASVPTEGTNARAQTNRIDNGLRPGQRPLGRYSAPAASSLNERINVRPDSSVLSSRLARHRRRLLAVPAALVVLAGAGSLVWCGGDGSNAVAQPQYLRYQHADPVRDRITVTQHFRGNQSGRDVLGFDRYPPRRHRDRFCARSAGPRRELGGRTAGTGGSPYRHGDDQLTRLLDPGPWLRNATAGGGTRARHRQLQHLRDIW